MRDTTTPLLSERTHGLIERIAYKLRTIAAEYPKEDLSEAVIITDDPDIGKTVCGLQHVYVSAGISAPLIGGIGFKAARMFQDCDK